MNQKTKTCQNCKTDFTIEPEDFEFYQKIDVPEPTFCPDCRLQRKMAFKKEMGLHKRKCDFSGKEVISQFSPVTPFKIYDQVIWRSDKWDPMDYGRDYDFSRPFFEQFRQLWREVPLMGLPEFFNINSDYVLNSANVKNGYLVLGSGYIEDSAYIYRCESSKDCYDSAYLNKCEICYQGFNLNNCYQAFYSSYCDDCQGIYFCRNCVGCSNCFGCANLKHKKYYIFNRPYSKGDYEKEIQEFRIGSRQHNVNLIERVKKHHLVYPVKFMHGRKNVNVTGEYIYNSRNVKDSYWIKGGEDIRFCHQLDVPSSKDCYDFLSFGEGCELLYEVVGSGRGSNKVFFSDAVFLDVHDIEYSCDCISSSYLFGCIGLHKKQYCVLNKQYTEKRYKELVDKIKKHMDGTPYTDKKGNIYKYGEFFPTEFSPFEYNGSLAQEFFPLTKEQAMAQGYAWYDRPKPTYEPTTKAGCLPDDIINTDDSVLKQTIECENKTKSKCRGSGVFRIVKQEYDFLKKNNLPLLRLCWECRHWERLEQRQPTKLWHRQCMNLSASEAGKPCPNEFETTYAPDRPEIVYCEACYQKEVG